MDTIRFGDLGAGLVTGQQLQHDLEFELGCILLAHFDLRCSDCFIISHLPEEVNFHNTTEFNFLGAYLTSHTLGISLSLIMLISVHTLIP